MQDYPKLLERTRVLEPDAQAPQLSVQPDIHGVATTSSSSR